MAKYEFKVGDRVQFKEWDEMEKEFGKTGSDALIVLSCPTPYFRKEMKHLCGTYATIKSFGNNSRVYLSDMTATGDKWWSYHVDMLKPASTKKQEKDEPKSEVKEAFGFKYGDKVNYCGMIGTVVGKHKRVANMLTVKIPKGGHSGIDSEQWEKFEGEHYWFASTDRLMRVVDKPTEHPTITAHLIEGNKTTVKLSDGRMGEVTCYYKDTFDPAVGVAEAYKKALGITKAEDKPKPKFEIGKKYVLPAVQGGRKEVVIEISNIDDRTGVYTYRIFDHDVYLSFRENDEFYNALIPYTDAIVKEVERVAKVGEYIKLNKNARNIFNNEKFCKGDIILVTDYGILPSVKLKNGAYLGFLCEDYVVLENYTPPAENKTTDATVKEVKREAHIGEYVKVVDANLNFGYRNGDILKVILKTFNAIVADSKGEGVTLWKGEYVVLEGYDPDIHGKI